MVTFLPNNEVSLKCEVNCKLSVGVGVLLFHSESEVVLPKPETGLEGLVIPGTHSKNYSYLLQSLQNYLAFDILNWSVIMDAILIVFFMYLLRLY